MEVGAGFMPGQNTTFEPEGRLRGRGPLTPSTRLLHLYVNLPLPHFRWSPPNKAGRKQLFRPKASSCVLGRAKKDPS